jgi:hypothetical protein
MGNESLRLVYGNNSFFDDPLKEKTDLMRILII